MFIKNLKKKSPRNITLIDAPMSGAPMSAKRASLTFMIGSTKAQFKNILPLLKLMGKDLSKIEYVGAKRKLTSKIKQKKQLKIQSNHKELYKN